MTTESIIQPLKKHLKQLHALAQNAEVQTLKVILDAEQLDPAAGRSNIDLGTFLDTYADLLLTIGNLTASNKELKEAMETSLSNRVANAIMVGNNLDLLLEVDAIRIAAQMKLVTSRETMIDAIRELTRNAEGREVLEWLKEGVKQYGGF